MTIGIGEKPKATILTKSIRDAHAFVDKHARNSGGRCLVIAGDYGSGKSHLASKVLDRLREQDPQAIICVVRAKSNDTLVSIYRRIFDQYQVHEEDGTVNTVLRRLDIIRRIDEVCAEIEQKRYNAAKVAGYPELYNAPEETPLTRSEAPVLAGDIDLTRALQERLTRIVGDREFAYGLSLLLHGDEEIAAHAWDWLRGGPVTSDIAKRGVEEPIEGEPRVMIALLALARLINKSGTRFALLVDDLEGLGAGSRHAGNDLGATLNLLFRWAADSGSLLTVICLAKTWQHLPEGVRQRVVDVIYPTPFSRADIIEYQLDIYKRVRIDGPSFTRGAFDRLYDISVGSPRKVVDTCYFAYQRVGGNGTVTARVIEEVSREIFIHTPPSEAAKEIRDFFSRLGHAVSEFEVGDKIAQMRLPVGADDAGCSVIVTGSIVNAVAADRLIRLAEAQRDASAGSSALMVVLVLVGQLAESQKEKVNNTFRYVLRWDDDGFWDDLRELVNNLVSTLGAQAGTELLRQMREDLHNLRSLQVDDHEALTQLARFHDEQRLRAMIRDEAHRAYLRSPSEAEVLDFGESFQGVQRVFDDAVSAIREALERLEQLWRSMFQSEEPIRLIDRSKAPGGRTALPSDLTPEPIIRALGVLVALDKSLDGFGRAIIELLRQEAAGTSVRKLISHQCGRFDKTIEDLVVYIPSSDEDANYTVYRVLGIDRVSILKKLQRLGATIYDTIYSADFRRRS